MNETAKLKVIKNLPQGITRTTRCLFKIRLVSYVVFRVLHDMAMKATMYSDSQNTLDFEKFMKYIGFFQR